MSNNSIQRVKGMYDLLPTDIPLWHRVETTVTGVLQDYGYRELRLPVLERTQLFTHAIGETTDVVSKEMYSFEDRSGVQLSLRPEGTAGCVRALISNGLLQGHLHKFWYMGPMFRRENVQRGRHRQFYQIGAEVFGPRGPDADAELILLLARIWRELGLQDVRLELNSLGTKLARERYRAVLVEYFSAHGESLDTDSQRRLTANPLRILDSKNPAMAGLIANAPRMADYLDTESSEHFATLGTALAAAGVPFVVNARLVRGLDYYSRTVFEWITEALGAQGTICAGGRYDSLVAMQGGSDCPAIGFAMGVDRIVALMQAQGLTAQAQSPHVFVVAVGVMASARSLALAESLRSAVSGLRVEVNLGGGSFKAQFKRADRSGATLALVLAEAELARGAVAIKALRDKDSAQREMTEPQLFAWLREWLVRDGESGNQSVE